MRLVFVTRPSALARIQTQWIIQALQKTHPNLICEEKIITTQGDKILNKPLPEIGGKGLFTQELESELISGAVHCAVHSLKDLPIENPVGLTIGCVPARIDARDVLISAKQHTLFTLPNGAMVGTSSPRRAAQLLAARPNLVVHSLRGNVDTRVRKAMEGQYDAILLAGAGLTRLGLDKNITEWLDLDVMLPAPGQGALAVQCRADDQTTLELLASLEDNPSRQAVTAERQFLLEMGGGCTAPVAAYATVIGERSGMIHLVGRVLSTDGRKVLNVRGQGMDASQLGKDLAQQAMAQGAREILDLVAAG
ncbi:MAG: hydroxymethylbilane synthase [Chloroflexi bacterium RBG_19FT_COMBO_50_10]|nr:MAG: hydroxymethylbilane synthase [Chloroflexi bacterium RBG_19FT_COMBO_50_10]